MTEETKGSASKTVKVEVRVPARRPKTGIAPKIGKYAENPLGGLSAYQKALLTKLSERGMLNIKEATSLFVALKMQQSSKGISTRYEDMTPEQQKVERNTCRKTFEKLAQRDLVDILDVPNAGERLNRNGQPITAVVGKIKAYKLKPGAAKLVAGL